MMNIKLDSVLSAVDKYVPGAQTKIKNLADKAKAYVNNLSELEMKVLDATNHEPWGPHGTVMREITNHAFNSEGFQQIMGIIDQRLDEHGENWRLCYKALLLLEFLIKHGPMRVAEACSSMRLSQLERLASRFEYKDATGKDEGINVRQRARDIVNLVTDGNKLREEREKAAKNQSKYTGLSSSSSSMGHGSSNYKSHGSSSYGNSGGGDRSYGTHGSSSSSSARDYGTGSTTSAAPPPRRLSPVQSSTGASIAADADDGLDPVEATRRRIARLKAEGALPDGGAASGAGALSPGLEDVGDSPRRAKKKLSDVRINPAISATFAKPGLLSPSSITARPASSQASPAAASIDLLGDLEGPVAVTPAPAAAGGADAGWDGFASAPSSAAAAPAAAAAAADEEWNAFDSAPRTAPKKGPIDLDDLLGVGNSSTTAPGGPLPMDAFSSMAAAPAPMPQASRFPIPSGFAAAPAQASSMSFSSSNTAAADPFAASSRLTPALSANRPASKTGPAAGQPKLGPETAKAKDPFADLAVL